MTVDQMHARQSAVDALLASLGNASGLSAEITSRIAELTEQLIENDNEQTRGRIKGLREVLELPNALKLEREDIAAALSDLSDAAQ